MVFLCPLFLLLVILKTKVFIADQDKLYIKLTKC